jgi:Zn-dependent protease/CBS domain-containing protein
MHRPDQHAGATVDPGSVRIATVAGIPIRLHFTFLILVAFLLIFGAGPSMASAVFVLALFACIVLHELGHSIVAQHYGIRVDSITLYPIGGLARITKRPTPPQELWVALAGPAVNFAIMGAVAAVLVALHQWVPVTKAFGDAHDHWFEYLALANAMLALFNLIPAFPMDGGRVLRALLALNGMPLLKATAIAATVGRVLAVIAGFFAVFNGQWILMFIAFFIYIGAGEEASAIRQETIFTGVPVSQVMVTELHTLSPGDTLKNAADQMLTTSQHDFPVVLGEQVVGLVTREALLRGLAVEGPGGYVASMMNREYPTAAPADDMSSIFSAATPAAGSNARLPLLVLSEGRLVGMLTNENVTEYFAVQQMLALGRRHNGSNWPA